MTDEKKERQKKYIPSELKERDQWIIWTEEKEDGELEKRPRAPWKYGGKYKYNASVKDSDNWTSFEKALEYANKKDGFGIGFCLSEKDPYAGLDFDHCIDENDELDEEIKKYVEKAESYTEVSPSGTGVHIIGKGELPEGAIKEDSEGVEAYEKDRFFTVTGDFLQGTKIIRNIQGVINEIWAKHGKEPEIGYDGKGTEQYIDITDVVPTENLEKTGGGLMGPHPIHGSENTGMNFKVDPENNRWFCFHQPGHWCGGGPFQYLAMDEGIIECGEWNQGGNPLTGVKFVKTVEAAKDRGLIGEKEASELIGNTDFEDPRNIAIPKLAEKENLRKEILDTIEIDVKEDRKTVETVMSVMLSAYSREPLNLFLRGPSSTGKSHAITETTKFAPDSDIELIGDMSPKYLVHQKGKMVDKNGDSLPPYPEEDDYESDEKFKETEKRWKKKAANGYNLIDLSGKILVFLEAPSKKTFEMLRPILSHDTKEYVYKFAESTGSGIHSNEVMLRGWPSTIFATTDVDFMDELVTRSLTITPNMSEEKYEAANEYAAEKFGIPLKDETDAEKKNRVREYIKSVKQVGQTVNIAIPYHEKLAEKYPSEKPQDMRDFKKFLSLILMQTLIHAFQRPLIKLGDEWILVSTAEDLENALDTFENAFLTTQTGVSQEILDVYKDVFKALKGERPGYDEILKRYNEEKDDPISREWLRTKVVKPLEHIGWLDVEPDPDDKRKKQFKMQGSKETFENLCEGIKGVVDEESVKKWLNEVSKIPLDIGKRNKAIFKSFVNPERADIDYLMKKTVNHKGKFNTAKSPSNGESEDNNGGKTKQSKTKVSQSEIKGQLANLLNEERPKVSELPYHFDSEDLPRVNEMLQSWKRAGKAEIGESGRWKLIN